MNLEEFLANDSLVAAYQKHIQSEEVQLGLAVLRQHHCQPVVPDADKLNHSTSEFCLGQNYGCWLLLDAVIQLGIQRGASQRLEETYGVTPEEDKNAKGSE
jgi:hypothetical protein